MTRKKGRCIDNSEDVVGGCFCTFVDDDDDDDDDEDDDDHDYDHDDDLIVGL